MTPDTSNAQPPSLSALDLARLRSLLASAGHPEDLPFHSVNSESGNIVAAAHSPERNQLLVVFAGSKKNPAPQLYQFDNVTAEHYGEFAMTFPDKGQSTGSHFHRVFRSRPDLFPAKKLEAGANDNSV